jgi:intein/homing endonuclease
MTDSLFISEEDIKKAEIEIGVPKFGPLGWITDYRTYRRHLPKLKRRETFFERNARTTNYNVSLALGMQNTNELQEEADLMYSFMNNFLGFPSGRTMWVGGTETSESNPACNFNCSFLSINRLSAFLTLFELLMVGTGVGYRVFSKDISQLPAIKNIPTLSFEDYNPVAKKQRQEDTTKEVIDTKWRITSGDSRQGWIQSLSYFLDAIFDNDGPESIIFNVDSIRPMGERINGFGGTASGPEALIGIIQDVCRIINECPTNYLRSIDCMDICDAIAKGVVAGSSRRSALICLFDQGDELCANAKVNMPEHKSYRWQSNNTECVGSLHTDELKLFLEANPDSDIDTIINFIDQFKPSLEWFEKKFETIAASGEPGLNNYLLMTAKRWQAVRQWRPNVPVLEIWDKYCSIGTNPCFAPGTLILTKQGYYPIEQLVGKKVDVWDGENWVEIDNFRVTGENQKVFRVLLHSGQEILATESHTFYLEDGSSKKLSELQPKDKLQTHHVKFHGSIESFSGLESSGAYLKGFLLGDGSSANEGKNPKLDLYEPKWNLKEALILSGEELVASDLVTNTVLDLGFKDLVGNRCTMQGLSARGSALLPWVTNYRQEGIPYQILNWDFNSKIEFIKGYFDADGTAYDGKNGFGYQITSINKPILEVVQLLLESLGIKSILRLRKDNSRLGGTYNFGSDKGGICNVQPAYRLSISQYYSINLSKICKFNRVVSFEDKSVAYKIKDKSNMVVSVSYSHIEEKVYCCTVPTNNKVALANSVVTGQCHEIILSAGFSLIKELISKGVSFCNLTTVPLQNFVINGSLNYTLLEQAIRLITRIGLRQTCVQMPTQELHETQIEERLLGVSATGWRKMMDMLGWNTGGPEIVHLQQQMRYWANDEATNYAAKLGVPRPLLVTCIKPEGTSSKVFGSSDGLHWEWAPYYIRRIQMSTTDALAKALKAQGFIWHPVPYDLDKHVKGSDTWGRIKVFEGMSDEEKDELFAKSNAVQFSFPIKAEAKVSQGEVSAIEQLENVRSFALNYTDHLPSSTVTVKPDEWSEVANWVHTNWKDYITAAFLSYWSGNYPLLPYEDIAEEKYQQLLSSFDPQYVTPTGFKVDEALVNLFELEDLDDGIDIDDVDLGSGCSTSSCPIR